MKRKHTGKIIILLVLMFASLFGNTISELLNMDVDYDAANSLALLLSLVGMAVSSLLMMAVPFIVRMTKKEPLPYKSGKRLCKWNSIIMFVISTVLLVFTEVNFVGGVGAIIYYFINKWIFVSDYQPEVQQLVATNALSQNHIYPVAPAQSTHICLSAEEETLRSYGNNIYGWDIMRQKEPELPLAVPIQPAPIQKEEPIQSSPTAPKQAVKYCSRCGQIIDHFTKKCRGCGKQYFKGISLKTAFIILLCVFLVMSFVGNIILGIVNTELREDRSSLEKTNTFLKDKNKKLKDDNKELEEENDEYYDYCVELINEIAFYDEHIVFVADNGTNLYHKYDCSVFQNCESFWAYNTEAAEAEGHNPCPQCGD